MNKIKRLESEMAQETEAAREELIALTLEIAQKEKQLRENDSPTTSAGRAKRRDMQEELEDLLKKQKVLHHEWSTAIGDRYYRQIMLLKDALGRLDALQTTFHERVRLGMWLQTEKPQALVARMRPLARELEVDLDSWLADYDFQPEETPVPAA